MTASPFPPTRQTALTRLEAFLPSAGQHYTSHRNHDLGPANRTNVSCLSPYIRHRLITEQEIVAAVLDRHGPAAAEKFIQEIVWRTYWRGWLEQRPQVWGRFVADVSALQSTASVELSQRLDLAMSGRTGIDCFDTWAHELIGTGYLHNHARMWFASIWIFTLNLPWQLGADFFLRHLLDGDAASNTLSWRWVGGLHTQGKTYLARPDNIATYTGGRFGDARNLANDARPLPPDESGPRRTLVPRQTTPPLGPYTLVVTDDDLGVETWPLDWKLVQSVILIDNAASYPAISTAVAAYKRGALVDTAARISARLSGEVPLTTLGPTQAPAIVQAWPTPKNVVMHEMQIGPSRTAFEPFGTALEKGGHSLHMIRRAWDAAFWPHATAGFFKVKDRIPTVLRELGFAL
jgi:deoxyribodipyrimidine photo-lyase